MAPASPPKRPSRQGLLRLLEGPRPHSPVDPASPPKRPSPRRAPERPRASREAMAPPMSDPTISDPTMSVDPSSRPASPLSPLPSLSPKGGVGVGRGRTGRARDEGTRSADIQIKGFGGSAPRKTSILLSRLPRAPDREGPSWKGLLRRALSVPIRLF